MANEPNSAADDRDDAGQQPEMGGDRDQHGLDAYDRLLVEDWSNQGNPNCG